MAHRNLDNYNNSYMRDKKNFIRNRTMTAEEQYKHTIEKIKENEEKYGKNNEIKIIGANDRLEGKAPQLFDDEQMQKAYSYGYFERGSSVLAGRFENGFYTAEEQKAFGIRDLMSGVKDKHLRILKDYPEYMAGRIYQKGRSIYDYVTKNNIQIDDYVDLMAFIEPEIKSIEFKKGYFDEKNSRENSVKKR